MAEFQLAAESFAEAINLEPGGFHQYHNAANLLHFFVYDQQSGNKTALEISIAYYEKAIKLSDERASDISPGERIALLNDASLALQKVSMITDAMDLVQKVLEIDPKNLQARGNLALLLMRTGNLSQASIEAQVAIDQNPENVQLRHNYGNILHALGDAEAAKKQWQKAVEINPLCVPSWGSLGHDEGHRGNLTGAVQFYEKALSVASSDLSGIILGDESEDSLRLQIATAVIPMIYRSVRHIMEVRSKYKGNLE
eukprot:13465215-Ditylum_brightwellii.AAC.1